MRKLLFIWIVAFVPLCLFAQEEATVTAKYIFHQLEFRETETDNILDTFPEMTGIILSASINELDFLCINIPDVHTYNLQIVNTVEDYPDSEIKVVMLQGGEKIDNIA